MGGKWACGNKEEIANTRKILNKDGQLEDFLKKSFLGHGQMTLIKFPSSNGKRNTECRTLGTLQEEPSYLQMRKQ